MTFDRSADLLPAGRGGGGGGGRGGGEIMIGSEADLVDISK